MLRVIHVFIFSLIVYCFFSFFYSVPQFFEKLQMTGPSNTTAFFLAALLICYVIYVYIKKIIMHFEPYQNLVMNNCARACIKIIYKSNLNPSEVCIKITERTPDNKIQDEDKPWLESFFE